jgi:release factor glutamine methyltransferase
MTARTKVAGATLSSWIARSGLPRHEAERLAAHALGVTWSDLWPRLHEPVDEAALNALAMRRRDGEPLAYIERSVVFYGLEIACGPGVLVPRPETETLVDVALASIETVPSPVVCDVGTGSGAVAIAIAKHRPDATVWATDISPAALDWAALNIAVHGTSVRLACCDLLDAVPGDLDLVVSNPPYVPDGTELPVDVRAEPREALFAGPRGTEILERLADEVRDAVLAVEVGTPEQAEWFAAFAGGGQVTLDHTGRPRVVCVKR